MLLRVDATEATNAACATVGFGNGGCAAVAIIVLFRVFYLNSVFIRHRLHKLFQLVVPLRLLFQML